MARNLLTQSHIRPAWLARKLRDLRPDGGQSVLTAAGPPESATSVATCDDHPQSALEALVLHLLVHDVDERLEPGRGTRTPAEVAKQLIDRRYAQVSTVAEIARAVGCHPAHLTRVFKARWGVPPSAYLRMVRVGASLQLLQRSQVKISAIPLLVGFRGKGAFYAAIKAATQRTPSQYRSRRVGMAAAGGIDRPEDN